MKVGRWRLSRFGKHYWKKMTWSQRRRFRKFLNNNVGKSYNTRYLIRY